MIENEYIDDSCLENIEGLLFSEEYADAEDNESLISEIAHSELSGESDQASEVIEENKEEKTDVNCPPEANNNEFFLSIDDTKDSLSKDFKLFAGNDLQNTLKQNIINKLSSFNPEKTKSFIRNGLYTDFLQNAAEKNANIQHSSINPNEPDYSIKNNFKFPTHSDFTENFRGINIPFISLEKTVFSIRDVFVEKNLIVSEKNYKDTEHPSTIASKIKISISNSPCEEYNQRLTKKNKSDGSISIDIEHQKSNVNESLSSALLHGPLKKDKTPKQISENTKKNKTDLNSNQNQNPSHDAEKLCTAKINTYRHESLCNPIKINKAIKRTFIESKNTLNNHQNQESFCNSARTCEVETQNSINHELKISNPTHLKKRTFCAHLKTFNKAIDFSTNLCKVADKDCFEEKAIPRFTKGYTEAKSNTPNTEIQKKNTTYTKSKETSNYCIEKNEKKDQKEINSNKISHLAEVQQKTNLVSKKTSVNCSQNLFCNPAKSFDNTTTNSLETTKVFAPKIQNKSKSSTKNNCVSINQKNFNSILSIQNYYNKAFVISNKKTQFEYDKTTYALKSEGRKYTTQQKDEKKLLKRNLGNLCNKKATMAISNDIGKKSVYYGNKRFSLNETKNRLNTKKGFF